MSTQQTVLVVEDDPRIGELVTTNLEAAGFACEHASDGDAGLRSFERRQPSLMIVDLMLPGIDGLELTRRVRAASRVPILMLTARSTDADKVLGFEIGADDYLTKPFSTLELVARVRALLRRAGDPEDEKGEVLERGPLRIDPSRRLVERQGERLELTSLEFDLLHFLARRPGHVFSREALLDRVWGGDRIVDYRSIDSMVSRIRRKLEADPAKPRFIQTVWGAGYRFPESHEWVDSDS